MHWQWSEEEDEAIHSLQNNAAQILYLRGFRKHMDFDTGIVGIKRRISYQYFIELIEERRDAGSHRPVVVPSASTIRWLISRMEKVGLIERLPDSGPMVFRLPLATIGAQQAKPLQTIPLSLPAVEAASEEQGKDAAGHPSRRVFAPCPHQQILAIWDEVMPAHIRRPKDTIWLPKRKAHGHLAGRWKDGFELKYSKDHKRAGQAFYSDTETGLVWWRGYFSFCAKSEFLMQGLRGFDLGWAVNPSNFINILDKKYHDPVRQQ